MRKNSEARERNIRIVAEYYRNYGKVRIRDIAEKYGIPFATMCNNTGRYRQEAMKLLENEKKKAMS